MATQRTFHNYFHNNGAIFILSFPHFLDSLPIFLITNGQPTDTWQDAVKKIEEAETNGKLLFFAVGVRDADMETLSEISVCRS